MSEPFSHSVLVKQCLFMIIEKVWNRSSTFHFTVLNLSPSRKYEAWEYVEEWKIYFASFLIQKYIKRTEWREKDLTIL